MLTYESLSQIYISMEQKEFEDLVEEYLDEKHGLTSGRASKRPLYHTK